MDGQRKKTLVVVVGPTASGKTAVSIEIARAFSTEVLSCDSRQFYHEIPIGTAAPTLEEQALAVHHFVASRSLSDDYNCGSYEHDAIALLDELFLKHDVVVMTGGSGLYVDAVCDGMDDIPCDTEIRAQVLSRLESEGLESLVLQLQKLDPDYCSKADLSNRQRVTRALEVCLASGRPYSSFRRGEGTKRNFEVVKIGLTMDRALLYDRINRRVDIMMEQGLEAEARGVYHLRELNALQTVGYREMFDYFDGTTTRDEAVELIKRNSRRYAKRQLTWFGRDARIEWFDALGVGVLGAIENYLQKFV